MYSKIAKFVREYSLIQAGVVFILGMTLLLRVIHSQHLPVFLQCIVSVFLFSFLLWSVPSIIMRRPQKLFEEEKQRLQNFTLEDFRKIYAEYADLVEEQIRLQNYDRELINEKWLENYHKYK